MDFFGGSSNHLSADLFMIYVKFFMCFLFEVI